MIFRDDVDEMEKHLVLSYFFREHPDATWELRDPGLSEWMKKCEEWVRENYPHLSSTVDTPNEEE